jgi:UDP-N-acetylglucosamine diphosphorylase / glucose-1-phosphate thymidylyltransferase / UDP-N-acetylgalactosamine diphosphorylase / glucosamine-1-phosphate N-acetyltransferase / galactosamine-1-phosphate N-acetyltransferase
MNAVSQDMGPVSDNFFPFTQTRSLVDIRCGILTIRDKWNLYLKDHPLFRENVIIPDNCIPDRRLIHQITTGNPEAALEQSTQLRQLTDILKYNGNEIKNDFQLITLGRETSPISSTNRLMGTNIFLEPGAIVEHCYLNATDGPIYIGKDVLIMEGSMIRGPFGILEKSVVKMGARIYGATSAGPHCVLGGEIKNSVFMGYTNKAHDGYLGDSVIGEWCNLAAGTSNSNIKNSGGPVKLWNPITTSYLDAGSKCGLMMGDYCRTAVNTSFNTGAVTGVCCHVFGNGPAPSYLPSFSWGFEGQLYAFDQAILHCDRWKRLKGTYLNNEESKQLKFIFDKQIQQQ